MTKSDTENKKSRWQEDNKSTKTKQKTKLSIIPVEAEGYTNNPKTLFKTDKS